MVKLYVRIIELQNLNEDLVDDAKRWDDRSDVAFSLAPTKNNEHEL